MIGIPEVLFYVATTALIVVSLMLIVLLYYGIEIARNIRNVTERVKKESERLENSTKGIRRVIGLLTSTVIGNFIFARKRRD